MTENQQTRTFVTFWGTRGSVSTSGRATEKFGGNTPCVTVQQGDLPFFQPAYDSGTSLTIYGSPKKGRFLASVLKGQMDYEYFPLLMRALEVDITIKEISEEAIHLNPSQWTGRIRIMIPAGLLDTVSEFKMPESSMPRMSSLTVFTEVNTARERMKPLSRSTLISFRTQTF
jgi:hypothetical protein